MDFFLAFQSSTLNGKATIERRTVRQRNKASNSGKSLDSGTNLVSISKNIISVRTILARYGIL